MSKNSYPKHFIYQGISVTNPRNAGNTVGSKVGDVLCLLQTNNTQPYSSWMA